MADIRAGMLVVLSARRCGSELFVPSDPLNSRLAHGTELLLPAGADGAIGTNCMAVLASHQFQVA